MVVSRMRAYRQMQGLSLYVVARETGISEPMLSLAERGLRRLKSADKEKVAQALNCKVEDLFEDDEDGGA